MKLNRRKMITALTAGSAAMLSGCGTIIYPDRANQKKRGELDASIVILDGIGLFFFLIPGLVAFAVDFATGAIYFPEGHEPGEREHTIFDEYHSEEARLDQKTIERVVARKTGKAINLDRMDVRVTELQRLDQFWLAYSQLANPHMLASR